MADFYTLAWMDRYVHPDPGRRADAHDRLVSGPVPTAPELDGNAVAPWRANLMSARYAGGFSLRPPVPSRRPVSRGGPRHEVRDLRVHAGLSPVGDWAGANADRPAAAPAG